MQPIPFTLEDQDTALTEGWGLFSVNVATGTLLEIQRFDEADIFQNDDVAREFVQRQAEAGSDLHRRAFALIGAPADAATHLTFPDADQTAALDEGWFVCESDGYYAIQRDDEAGVFDSDDAAVAFVSFRAKRGGALHRRAMALHGQPVQDGLVDKKESGGPVALTIAEQDAARAEGWSLNVSEGVYKVQRSVNAAVFDRDADAVRFVEHRAIHGSHLHRRAMALHYRSVERRLQPRDPFAVLSEGPFDEPERAAAAAEGWGLACKDGRYVIKRLSDSAFDSDALACVHVQDRAESGSRLHVKAREWVDRFAFAEPPLECGGYDKSARSVHITSRDRGPAGVHAIVIGDRVIAERYARLMAAAPRLHHTVKALQHVAVSDPDGDGTEFAFAMALADQVIAETET